MSKILQPKFKIIEKRHGYEIRQYDPYIVAETVVDGEFKKSLYEGFRILASYIFGGNRANTQIKMTAPVMERSSSSSRHVVSFVMPNSYSMNTLPKPNDSRIATKLVDTHLVAVLRFRGSGRASRVEQKKLLLKEMLIRDNIYMVGTISYAGYSRPTTIPFLRKNEVMVEVK